MEEKPQADTLFGDEEDDRGALAEINFDVNVGRWLLKVIGGPNNGAEFSMHAGSAYLLGTDPNSCDIVFHDTSVSRQHARLTIGADDGMSIEDLKSRNGTIVDGETIKGKRGLLANTVVTLGTTSFTIYDREGEMHTVISPLLPAIVKVLQQENPPPAPAVAAAAPLPAPVKEALPKAVEAPKPKAHAETLGALIVLGVLTGLFAIIGVGTFTLFKTESVQVEQLADPTAALEPLFKQFPAVHPYFNKSSGKLQLIGHVLTPADKNRLINSLQGYPFIREIEDSSLVVDEYAWTEVNLVLSRNNWKGISVQSFTPGKFVLSGYLKTRAEADQLYAYIASIFPYIDRLEKKVIIEEDTENDARTALRKENLREVSAKLNSGTLSLSGKIARAKQAQLQAAIVEIEKLPGIHEVKNSVEELEPEQAVINLTDRYTITGVSRRGNNYSVVIQGHILTQGDELDGMIIKEIRQNAVLLEKEGVKYRIDFSR